MFIIIGGDGKEYGPVTADQVQTWINSGRANLETQAKRVGDAQWSHLRDFPAFTQSDTAAPVSPLTPPPTHAASAGLALADRAARLGAVILDQLIAIACALPGVLVLFAAGVFSDPNNANPVLMVVGFCLVGVALAGLLVYQIRLLGRQGQTIGKRIAGVKIVNFSDEGNPGMVQAVVMRAIVGSLPGCIPFIGGIYNIVDVCFIFRDDRRCIHDFIAGTKVVKA